MKAEIETKEIKHKCTNCGNQDDIDVEIHRKPTKVVLEDDSDIRESISELKKMITTKPETPKEPEKPKEIRIKEYPSHMPGEICLSGNCEAGGVHRNKNYSRKPAKKCTNCDQFAPAGTKKCPWCKKDEFDDLEDDDLTELGIPLPKIEEHEHNHEGE